MKLGNILACIGIILGIIGVLCLPLYNFNELPYLADSGYAKGGGWKLLAQSGIFIRPGIILIILGGVLYMIAKILPRKFWKTSEDLFEEEIKRGKVKH
ncbi:MAG: hypothetical protein ACYC9M_07090 [Desulfobulbaceae bacterium]